MSGPVYCGRCGEPGHATRVSFIPDMPLVVCGKTLIPGTRDLEESLRIRAAYRLEQEAKAKAKHDAMRAQL